MKTADIKVFDELIHYNLILNIPTGLTISKEMDIDNYRTGNMKVYDNSISDRTIQTIENVSIVVVTFWLKAKHADKPIEGKFRYLRVWKLGEYSWKVIAGSRVLIQ